MFEENQGTADLQVKVLHDESVLPIYTLQLHIVFAFSVEMNLTNRVGEILGFGETTEGNTKLPCTLQRAYIQIFTIKQCNESELPSHTLTPRVLCAGVIGGGVDSCQVGNTTQVITYFSYSCSERKSTFLCTPKVLVHHHVHQTCNWALS